MRHLLIILSALFLYSIHSWASCADVVSELRAMKDAQTSIQDSLVSNHEMFAITLESYSEALTESAGKAHKVVSTNMLNSAESFRHRGMQAHKTAAKLEDATEDLIQRVSKCIKKD
jgi:hypothetical protein